MAGSGGEGIEEDDLGRVEPRKVCGGMTWCKAAVSELSDGAAPHVCRVHK